MTHKLSNTQDAIDMFTGPGDYQVTKQKKILEAIRNAITICFLLHWHQFGAVQVEGANATAGIFVTFPGPGISNFNGAVDQVSSAHPSSSNHILLLFFLLILFLIARWLEPPCFFLPSARSTTRQTPQFLQGGSNCTVFFPYIILILESFVFCVNLAIFLPHYSFSPQPWPSPGRIGRRQHWHLLWT